MRNRAIATVAGAALTACTGLALAPPGSAAPVRSCPAQGGYQISIYSPDISCSDAYATASNFNLQGAKRQQFGSFTCEAKNAQQKGPTGLEFSCARSPGDGGFSVSRA